MGTTEQLYSRPDTAATASLSSICSSPSPRIPSSTFLLIVPRDYTHLLRCAVGKWHRSHNRSTTFRGLRAPSVSRRCLWAAARRSWSATKPEPRSRSSRAMDRRSTTPSRCDRRCWDSGEPTARSDVRHRKAVPRGCSPMCLEGAFRITSFLTGTGTPAVSTPACRVGSLVHSHAIDQRQRSAVHARGLCGDEQPVAFSSTSFARDDLCIADRSAFVRPPAKRLRRITGG